jgi:hypothetical protein
MSTKISGVENTQKPQGMTGVTNLSVCPKPVYCTADEVLLAGHMASYTLQAEASERIPDQ